VLIALPPAEAEENQKTESTEKEKRDTLHVAVRNSIKKVAVGILFYLGSVGFYLAWPAIRKASRQIGQRIK